MPMQRSAIILAGGSSTRIQHDKGLLPLANKPLVKYVLDGVRDLVEETIVVVSSESQERVYMQAIGAHTKIVVDTEKIKSPLVGAFTGFQTALGDYSLLLPCDAPFISKDVSNLLFELCIGKNAVIPRWPDSLIEPLHAVYYTQSARDASQKALDEGQLKMQAMIDCLRGVRYISTLVLQQIDVDLKVFFNVNTLLDMKKAETMLRYK